MAGVVFFYPPFFVGSDWDKCGIIGKVLPRVDHLASMRAPAHVVDEIFPKIERFFYLIKSLIRVCSVNFHPPFGVSR